MLLKFGKKDSAADADRDPVPVVELVGEEAPEPVPERKTSDETSVEMAESTLVKEEVRMQEEEFPEQEEDPWYEEETDNTGEEE